MQKAPAVWKAMFHCMSIGKNYYTACSIDFVNLWLPAPNCIKQFWWLPELNRLILANQVWRYNLNNCFNCNVKPDWQN